MDTIQQLTNAIVEFRDLRDWEQFHNPKDLALALSIEASELNELFLWKGNDEADPVKLKEELADVFMFALLLAHQKGLDVKQIVLEKLQLNAGKYPVDKSKGNAKKYDQL